ncbi:unnamed protein product [Linum trigynum]|uniref:Uncharacterized protein n=1 Tax=Linum trigynum TaxID=586398 RepID=A0AAV2GIB7_9ROSI
MLNVSAEQHQQTGEAACIRIDNGMLQIQNQEKEERHQEATHENNVYKELLSSRVDIIHLSAIGKNLWPFDVHNATQPHTLSLLLPS